MYANGVKIYQFKVKDSEIRLYPLFLDKISKDFTVNNITKTGLNGYVYDFPIDYNTIDVSDIVEVHKYILKKRDIN